MKTDSAKEARGKPKGMLRFFIPLAIQSASMSFSYLFVAAIVTEGSLKAFGISGSAEYAAFSQGLTVLWVLAALGMGLPTTALVFCKTRENMRSFSRMNYALMLGTNLLQLLVCLVHPLDRLVFGSFLGFSDDPVLFSVARNTLLGCIPVQMLFYCRNMYLARLLIEKRSDLSNIATMARIAFSIALSPLFVRLGCVGYKWGVVAMFLPVLLEFVITRHFAMPGIRTLGDPPEAERASAMDQLRFTIPLSFGGLMLSVSGFMTGFFMGHLPNHENMLAIHYIMLGVVNPVSFAALRVQSVTITFADETDGGRKVLPFALAVGAAFSCVTLVGQIPPLARWYFGSVQHLPGEFIGAASFAMLLALPIPLGQALRGHAEGLAAVRRRPNAILSGQTIYLAVLVCALALMGKSSLVPGYAQGAVALALAIWAALTTTHVSLLAGAHEPHLSSGQFGTGVLRTRR
ncbi:MAG: hypothetical protein IJS46_02050 [Kiritimatiellae bacterium]|nr:hypothetical protein [Kiritimatiellia bacterium]